MISPAALQAAIVARLKAYAPLIAEVTATEIREAEWKSTKFVYPNVRVQRPMLSAWGNGNCSSRTSRVQVTVTSSSKLDSSINAQILQGLIVAALDGQRFETSDVIVQTLRPQQVAPASVAPGDETAWVGPVTFRGIATEK